LIAATHQELPALVAAGRFRQDLYYRLCADRIETPSLRQQLADRPEDLGAMVRFIAGRIAPHSEALAEELAGEILGWIEAHLGPAHPWPGNFRELEQCARNVVVHGSYLPASPASADPNLELARALAAHPLASEELSTLHCTAAVYRAGNYLQAAKDLGLDRRTVKARVDRDLLRRLQRLT
jgi:DNA-binding NtrC family response regulator